MALHKGKNMVEHKLAPTHSGAPFAQRQAPTVRDTFVSARLRIVNNAILQGIGSLGNVSGGYVRFEKYMRGNYVRDMRKDWEVVRECMNDSVRTIR